MNTLRIVTLIIGVLAFAYGVYNIVFAGLPHQWFGFVSGAYLIWLFFNMHKFYSKESKKQFEGSI